MTSWANVGSYLRNSRSRYPHLACNLGGRDAKVLINLPTSSALIVGSSPRRLPLLSSVSDTPFFLHPWAMDPLDPSPLSARRLLALHDRFSLAQDTFEKFSAPLGSARLPAAALGAVSAIEPRPIRLLTAPVLRQRARDDSRAPPPLGQSGCSLFNKIIDTTMIICCCNKEHVFELCCTKGFLESCRNQNRSG